MIRNAVAAMAVVGISGLACLDPRDPVLEARDTQRPTVVRVDPAADLDGGTTLIPSGTQFVITFSEPMDLRTLRPGILLLQDNTPLPINILVPPDNGIPIAVQQTDVIWRTGVNPVSPLPPNSNFRLVLEPVLTDTEGNPLLGPDGGTGTWVFSYRTGMP